MTLMRAALSEPTVSLSIVSHGQFDIVSQLLEDLERFRFFIREIILTINIPEVIDIQAFENNIQVCMNRSPKGFGENHNRAFEASSGEFFVVLNPDLRIRNFEFPLFLEKLSAGNVGVITPIVENCSGEREDHVRPFPTVSQLLRRCSRLLFPRLCQVEGQPEPLSSFWVAGMFMGFNGSVFRDVGGFDQRYFMYLEDVDICAELRVAGYEIAIDYDNRVTHDARRGSRRNVRLFLIHCFSYLKYFKKWAGKSFG